MATTRNNSRRADQDAFHQKPKHHTRLEADVLFASIGEGAIITDENGNISKINDIALRIMGLKRESVLQQWYPSVIKAEDETGKELPKLERPITEVFLTGLPVYRRIFYRRPDGERVPVAVTVSPLMFEGRPIGAIQVFRDITEELELERAKDEFISIASHQLRTPATVVKQYIGMVLEGYIGDITDDQRATLQTAYDSNERQINIVNDLLAVAQAASDNLQLNIQPTDLTGLITGITKNYVQTFKKKQLTLLLDTPDLPVRAEVDANQIRMVVENLLDNAYKYSEVSTNVTITLDSDKHTTTITVGDQGVGIAAKDIPRLFQKFSRIQNPLSHEGGTGLGLYWAKRLIDQHNGQLLVESKLGVGTTFIISLPTTQTCQP
jgi:PAS domain S-box-containing protein